MNQDHFKNCIFKPPANADIIDTPISLILVDKKDIFYLVWKAEQG